LDWLARHLGTADQEEDIAHGARTAEEIAAYCWRADEQNKVERDIETIKAKIEELNHK
jgi:ubiquinone biosynthesis protein UbiJ